MQSKIFDTYTASNPPIRIVSLARYAQHHKLGATLLGGIMFNGATGSCMDALARGMLEIAIERGALRPGYPVIEASSGSFGAALTICAAQLGYHTMLVMPANVPMERQRALSNLGATIVSTATLNGRAGATQRAQQLCTETGGYFVNYFNNDDNPEYHRRVTGPAILNAIGENFDYIVMGVGSGGTITGVGEYIKAWTNGKKIVAVEPFESNVISGGFAGKHGILGLGCGFVPENYNPYIVDKVQTVTTMDANETAVQLLMWEGIPAASASGATVWAAKQLAAMPENAGKHILALLGSRREY